MKKLKFYPIFIFVILTILSSPYCMAQETTDGDWEILFNGKDLSGWKELNGEHIWEAKDGMIIGTFVIGQPNGFLCTEKEYDDFIFECDVSIDTLMNNSGIEFRNLSLPDYREGRVHGYQMEIDPKPQRWSGSIYEEGGTRGWLYITEEFNPAAQNAFKNNQWNRYRIECNGNTIRTWINGVPCINLEDAKFPKGFFGLQLHANRAADPAGVFQVRFRDLRVQTTNLKFSPPDEIFVVNTIPNNISLQEKENGYSLLWDGKTTKGWKAAYKDEFPERGWEIKDGELMVVPSSGQESFKREHIITEKQYGAFELKFDFKLTEGTNSGVKYFVDDSDENNRSATSSLEYQIVDNAVIDENDSIRTLGSLADLLAPTRTVRMRIRIGEWYQGVIRVLPTNKVEYFLNGYKMLEYQRGSAEFADMVAKSKYQDLPNFGMAPKGHILLENNGSSVSYRSIKIRELK